MLLSQSQQFSLFFFYWLHINNILPLVIAHQFIIPPNRSSDLSGATTHLFFMSPLQITQHSYQAPNFHFS